MYKISLGEESMKYFQKLKCLYCKFYSNNKDNCHNCDGSGIIKGADITSTIKPILDLYDKYINFDYEKYRLPKEFESQALSDFRCPDCSVKIYGVPTDLIKHLKKEHDWIFAIFKDDIQILQKAKQIIEDNVIIKSNGN